MLMRIHRVQPTRCSLRLRRHCQAACRSLNKEATLAVIASPLPACPLRSVPVPIYSSIALSGSKQPSFGRVQNAKDPTATLTSHEWGGQPQTSCLALWKLSKAADIPITLQQLFPRGISIAHARGPPPPAPRKPAVIAGSTE